MAFVFFVSPRTITDFADFEGEGYPYEDPNDCGTQRICTVLIV